MNTKNWTRYLTWGVLGLVSQQVYSQVTVPNNNGQGGAFVGWNAGANQILEVKNEANQPIDFYTRAIHRMRLNPNAGYHIGSVLFGTQNASGFLGISPNNSLWNPVNSPGPFTRLHLHDGSNFVQQSGYRPQMRNGVTLTGNRDHMYMGQLHYSVGRTDAAIVWSDKHRLRQPRSVAGAFATVDRGGITDTRC